MVTEGKNSYGPYHDARPQDPIFDATNALAHRLRLAVATGWDGERCDAAAAEFVGEMTRRGWSPPRPAPAAPTWRGKRNPEAVERGVAAARAALAAARTAEATP